MAFFDKSDRFQEGEIIEGGLGPGEYISPAQYKVPHAFAPFGSTVSREKLPPKDAEVSSSEGRKTRTKKQPISSTKMCRDLTLQTSTWPSLARSSCREHRGSQPTPWQRATVQARATTRHQLSQTTSTSRRGGRCWCSRQNRRNSSRFSLSKR